MFEVVNPRKTQFEGDSSLTKLQARINANTNGRVRVRDLQVVSKSDTKRLKEGEDQKTKTYRALCILPDGSLTLEEVKHRLENVKDLELGQKTPVRVMHRRPNNLRKRTVYWMEVLPASQEVSPAKPDRDHDKDKAVPTVFVLRLATQAGTYVKEFVHGDFQRTKPNVRTILECPDVDILALDVEVTANFTMSQKMSLIKTILLFQAIDLDWPPSLEDETEVSVTEEPEK